MFKSRVYPIVDSAAWVARLVANGARLVQLRIKSGHQPTLKAEIRAARADCAAAGATLVVNDHWRLGIEEGAGAIHLGQEDVVEADRDAIARSGALLGISTHSEAELNRALSLAPDYVALGPIYPTTLKQMPWAPQGPARLGAWKERLAGVPLVAIGGITLERAPDCLAAGADCVAAVSDILSAPAPEQRLRAWISRLDG